MPEQRAAAVGWMSPARFDRDYRQPGVDLLLGSGWGPRGDQRVYLQHGPGLDRGQLYAYDPLWNEYAVLASDVSRAEAIDTAARVAADANGVARVDELALAIDPAPRLDREALAARSGIGGVEL